MGMSTFCRTRYAHVYMLIHHMIGYDAIICRDQHYYVCCAMCVVRGMLCVVCCVLNVVWCVACVAC